MASPVPNPVAAPVAEASRIDAIDVLRGVAVLGILVLNIQAFAMPGAAYFNPTAYGDLEGANLYVWVAGRMLADQKFMTIFSMLFGASIVLMTERAEARRAADSSTGSPNWCAVFGVLVLPSGIHRARQCSGPRTRPHHVHYWSCPNS